MEKKKIIIVIAIIIGVTIVSKFTFAKYNLVKSIKIAEGTINYKLPDFKMMAMYKNDGNGDIEIDTMPESGYAINETKSYCELNGNKDSNARVYSDEELHHIISNITKGSKCYLYFDNYRKVNTSLGEITVKLATPDFSKTSCTSGCGETTVGIYQAKDDDGMSYYYRGDVENNYVKFANKWWRIIRINGDGSIRLIYDGTSAHNNGEVTTDSIAIANQALNKTFNNNAYVGFKYTSGEVHGLSTKSNVLTQLETWYQNNLTSFANKIDTNAGFCGDRTPSTSNTTSNGSGGTGMTVTYYGPLIRLSASTISPVLTCSNANDLYTVSSSTKGNKSLTYPIGLISADEVSMAGGSTANNYGYYLYNGQAYWTLSPRIFNGSNASMFFISSTGNLDNWYVNTELNVRPVINLKADVTLTGNGTISSPYVVIS